MQRYRIDISYDGSAYSGWQIQPENLTIQEEIENIVYKITGEKARIHSSSRTDCGVHARKQVAHFDLNKPLKERAIFKSLNALLPADIRIIKTRKVDLNFHARYNVSEKEYRYFIWNAEVMPPFLRNYRTHKKVNLNIDNMSKSALSLIGKHDFSAFSANRGYTCEQTVRELFDLKIKKKGSEVVIIAKAEGFLYKMVRSIAGFLIRVGEGKEDPVDTEKILASQERTARVPSAPSKGLFLWNIIY